MKIEKQQINGASIIRIKEENLDYMNNDAFKEIIAEEFGMNKKGLIIDFNDVKYISSICLGLLMHFGKQSKRSDKKLKIINVRPEVLKLLKVMLMDEMMDLSDSEEDAINDFK